MIRTFFKAENLKEEQAERVLRQSIGSCSPLKRSGNKHHGAEFVYGFTCGYSRTKSQGGASGKGLEADSCSPLKRSGNKHHHHRHMALRTLAHMPGRTLAHMPGRTLAKHNQENSSSGFSRCRICICVYMWAFTDKISEPTQCLCSPSQPARSPASF